MKTNELMYVSVQDLEHFISLFNALMEHSTHIEQQIKMEQENSEADSIEDQLKHHLPLQDMMKRAPQDAIRKGNDLLRTLEQVRKGFILGGCGMYMGAHIGWVW